MLQSSPEADDEWLAVYELIGDKGQGVRCRMRTRPFSRSQAPYLQMVRKYRIKPES